LIVSMKKASRKTIWIILPIVLFFLLCCASTQKERTESRDADFYINRENTYFKKDQYDQAIIDYTKALEIVPGVAEVYFSRGCVYHKQGQYDHAIADYTKALEINPGDALAYYNRGRAYYSKGEFDKSWDDIKKAEELGYQIPSKFLDDLRKASGRQN